MRQTLLELGRVCLALDDAAGVRVVLRQPAMPSGGSLTSGSSKQIQELGSKVDAVQEEIAGVSSLTRAELRLLPLLPTPLTDA